MHRKSELTSNSLEEPQFDAYVTKAARHLSVIHGQMSQASDNGSDPLVGDVDMRKECARFAKKKFQESLLGF